MTLSIRAKLTIWYLALVSLVLIVFSGVIYIYLSRSLLNIIDDSLMANAELLARSYQSNLGIPSPTSEKPPQPTPSIEPTAPDQANTEGQEGPDQQVDDTGNNTEEIADPITELRQTALIVPQFIQFLDDKGTVVDEVTDSNQKSPPVTPESLMITEPKLTTITISNTEQARIATWPLFRPNSQKVELYIRVGQSLADLQRAQLNVLWTLGISVPITLLLASLGGLLLANRTLSPVAKVAEAARRLSATNLRERVTVPSTGDEVSLLATLFNEMIERLEKAFERERRFTADASHELRTPLAVLRGELELALRKERPIEEYREVLSRSLEEIVRLSRLVEDLLTLARSENGELVLEQEKVPIDNLAAELCHYLEPLAEAKGLSLEFSAPAEKVTLIGDARRLRQLLLNLLDNAIKYTPEGGQVNLQISRNKDGIGIDVSDTGCGIAADEVGLIFERFYRHNHVKNQTDAGGFGLGLAICKWIVEAHGGNLAVVSNPGQGSRFSVFFPNHQK